MLTRAQEGRRYDQFEKCSYSRIRQIIYIRDFLGHTTIQSTERYAKVSQMAITKVLTEWEIPNVIPVNESDETVKKSFPRFLE